MGTNSNKSKKYDIVVFGATGFTGQFVVDAVARAAEQETFTWAVAGRNMSRLQTVLAQSSKRTGKSLEDAPIIIADTTSASTLDNMAKEARIVLNCVGPYRFFGEPVVKACVEQGSHYLDICGEPEFLEKMQLLYNAAAKENSVFVIGATGFDCIPAEVGFMYSQDQFKANQLSGVESFLTLHYPQGGAANFATYESAVHGFSQWKELAAMRKSLYPEPMPKIENKLPRRSGLFYSDVMSKWCLPFMGADKSVVYRTIRDHLRTKTLEKPVEFLPYVCLPSFFSASVLIFMGIVLGVMSKFSLGRWLLLTFPGFFTFGFVKRGGPKIKQIESASFSMTFMAYGFDSTGHKKRQVTAKLAGPEVGYVATPICMVQCALVLLKERDTMNQKSGVLTPGAAFTGTSLISRLDKHGINITTVSDTSL